MAPLRALVGVLLLLVVTAAVHAEWQPYGAAAVGGERYYLDPATIKPTPVGFTVTVLSNYPVPIKESFGTFQSVKSAVELDCGKQQLRDIDIQFHRQPMGKGKVVFQQMGTGEFSSWPVGSLNERLHEALCQ
jgi:hypothetical protein